MGGVGDHHSAVYSPGGREIVFTSTRDGPQDLYRAAADGSAIVRLTDGPPGFQNQDPCWSPDGAKIVWNVSWYGGRAIYVMNRDGSGKARVNVGEAKDAQPQWSASQAKPELAGF